MARRRIIKRSAAHASIKHKAAKRAARITKKTRRSDGWMIGTGRLDLG